MSIGSVILNDVEIASEDALKILTLGQVDLGKVTSARPSVLAAIGTVMSAVSAAVAATGAAAAGGGLNVALDGAALTALEGVWPDVKTFLSDLNITV